MAQRKTVGAFELVDIPEFDITDMVAKIDTGAYSGALHCDDIQEITENGKKKLCFIPTQNHTPHTTEHYVETMVRSSTGHQVKRYLIDTEVVLHGEVYPVRIGLSDRSEMKYDMLVGRRFLREQNLLVDVRLNQEYDTDGTQSL